MKLKIRLAFSEQREYKLAAGEVSFEANYDLWIRFLRILYLA